MAVIYKHQKLFGNSSFNQDYPIKVKIIFFQTYQESQYLLKILFAYSVQTQTVHYLNFELRYVAVHWLSSSKNSFLCSFNIQPAFLITLIDTYLGKTSQYISHYIDNITLYISKYIDNIENNATWKIRYYYRNKSWTPYHEFITTSEPATFFCKGIFTFVAHRLNYWNQ